MEPTQGIFSYIKAAISPRGWRDSITTVIQFGIALGYLYFTGNKVQMVEEINWIIAIILALTFTFIFRLCREVLAQTSIAPSVSNFMLTLFVLIGAGAFAFGYHGTTKRMDSADIDEYRNKSHYRDDTVLLRNVVGTDGMIRNKTFEGCRIIGPAYFYVISDIHLEHSRELLNLNYLTVSDSQSSKQGAILIDSCTFVDSWFENVTIIGNEAEIAVIRRKIVRNEGALSF